MIAADSSIANTGKHACNAHWQPMPVITVCVPANSCNWAEHWFHPQNNLRQHVIDPQQGRHHAQCVQLHHHNNNNDDNVHDDDTPPPTPA
jgi:hypothetical protein